MVKKVLIDLTQPRYPNCGLGQVALNFGKQIAEIADPALEWHFLTTKPSVLPCCGKKMRYKTLNLLSKHGFLPPNLGYDLFHISHQHARHKASGQKKNIFTIHDLNFLTEQSGGKQKKSLARVQQHVHRASVVVCISEFTASQVRKHLHLPASTPLHVIYNGVKTPDSEIAEKPDYFLPDKKCIFTIGALMEKKNFHTLVDMMSYLPETYYLIIAGEKVKGYTEQIKARIDFHGLGRRIILPGIISEPVKSFLYHHCDAFAFPSKLEGFGLPVIEAMRCGKPTFCAALTSLPEIGSTFAYYWHNFKPGEMAKILCEGMHDFQTHKSMRIAEMTRHANTFSWAKNARTYHQLYRKVLDLD